jgi:transposase
LKEELAMRNVIMIGCDLHDESMLLKTALNRQEPEMRSVKNTASGRRGLVRELKKRAAAAGNARVVLAYEASSLGFGFYDELTDAGIECYVLAPTRIAHSQRHRSQKTDEKDAQQLLELLRGHVLAGNPLPAVWVPDLQTRDDRELVRMRLDVGEKIVALRTQVQSLLKRNNLRRPKSMGKGWTKCFWVWLTCTLAKPADPEACPLEAGAREALASLLRQIRSLEQEQEQLDLAVSTLAHAPRYVEAIREMTKLKGVGTLTALVFLTEMGDLTRFSNRRQVGAYLGLAPTSHESGEANDRKGHISHQGSPRIRKVLCQATWSRVRWDNQEHVFYERLKARNPKKTKIAVVASMRRLGVRMWHRGIAAQPGKERPRAVPLVFPGNKAAFAIHPCGGSGR